MINDSSLRKICRLTFTFAIFLFITEFISFVLMASKNEDLLDIRILLIFVVIIFLPFVSAILGGILLVLAKKDDFPWGGLLAQSLILFLGLIFWLHFMLTPIAHSNFPEPQ